MDCFEVYGSFSSKYTSTDQNTVSRFRNVLAQLIQDKVILPKFIVVVPDDDIIKYFGYNDHDMTKAYYSILNNIMAEHNKLLMTQKEFLPLKAKKFYYPQIIWIQAPIHKSFNNNNMRELFNHSLNEVVKFHDNTFVLDFKKIWDPENGSLYVQESNRFTSQGLTTYWLAVDCTLRFADSILWKKIQQPVTVMKTSKKRDSSGRYTWVADRYREDKHAKHVHHSEHRSRLLQSLRRHLPSRDSDGRKLPKPY